MIEKELGGLNLSCGSGDLVLVNYGLVWNVLQYIKSAEGKCPWGLLPFSASPTAEYFSSRESDLVEDYTWYQAVCLSQWLGAQMVRVDGKWSDYLECIHAATGRREFSIWTACFFGVAHESECSGEVPMWQEGAPIGYRAALHWSASGMWKRYASPLDSGLLTALLV